MKITALATAVAVAAIGAATAARADVITTYTFSETTVDGGGVLSGSFQVDQTLYDEATDSGYVAGSSTIAITGDSSAVLNGSYTKFVEFDGEFVDFENASSADVGILIGEPPQTTGSITQNQFGFFPGFGDTFQINRLIDRLHSDHRHPRTVDMGDDAHRLCGAWLRRISAERAVSLTAARQPLSQTSPGSPVGLW